MNRESKIRCPYYNRFLPLNLVAKYLLRGTAYETECPHCLTKLKPVKEPIPFMWCVSGGSLSGVVPFYLYIHFVEDNFFKAIFTGFCIGIVLIALISLYVINYIEFKES